MITQDDIDAMKEPQTFDEWMAEIENYASREDRFWDTFHPWWVVTDIRRKAILSWMKAAYEVGYKACRADK